MNTFREKFFYYFKDTMLNYSYILGCDIVGLLLMLVTRSDTIEGYIGAILSAMNMFLYFAVIKNAYMKTGEEAMREKHSNDIERRDMLTTRRYRELDKVREYTPKKILIFLAPIVIPCVLLLSISTIIAIFGGNPEGLNTVITFAYAFVFSFFVGISKTASAYFAWFALAMLVAPLVYGYLSGVKKVCGEYAIAEKVKNMVDGEEK